MKTPTEIAREAAVSFIADRSNNVSRQADDLQAIILKAAREIVEGTGAREALNRAGRAMETSNEHAQRRFLAHEALGKLDALRTEAGK